jgi:hypothetical protein
MHALCDIAMGHSGPEKRGCGISERRECWSIVIDVWYQQNGNSYLDTYEDSFFISIRTSY